MIFKEISEPTKKSHGISNIKMQNATNTRNQDQDQVAFFFSYFHFQLLGGPRKKNTRLITNVGGKRCEYDQAIHVNLS